GAAHPRPPHRRPNLAPPPGRSDRYPQLTEPFFDGMARISIATDDRELREGAGLTETVTRQIEVMPQLANALALPATVSTAPGDKPGINNPDEIAKVARLQTAFTNQAAELREAPGPYAAVAKKYYPTKFTDTILAQAKKGIATGQVDVDKFLGNIDVPLDQAYIGYRNHVAAAPQAPPDHLNHQAQSRQHDLELLVVLTFGAALALTVLVSLSITRPLHALTNHATEMAARLLPDAVAQILRTPMGEDVVVP